MDSKRSIEVMGIAIFRDETEVRSQSHDLLKFIYRLIDPAVVIVFVLIIILILAGAALCLSWQLIGRCQIARAINTGVMSIHGYPGFSGAPC